MSDVVGSTCDRVAEVGDLITALLTRVAALPDPATEAARALPSDDRLRELLVGLEAVRNAAEAVQAEVMVAIGREAQALDREELRAGVASGRFHEEFVPDEIAALLACTTMAAGARYDTACRASALPTAARAWRAGQIDGRKTALICQQSGYLDPATRESVCDDAVGYAAGHTGPQLRAWLRRRVIAADPQAAERRRQQALADRRVVITAGDDGVSQLWALLPSVQARQIQKALTSAAIALGADDARTMDQRRADVAVDLLLGRAVPPEVEVQLVVSEATVAGRATDPAELAGLGPLTPGETSDLLGPAFAAGDRTTWRRPLTDPVTGTLIDRAEERYRPSAALDRAVRARDLTCRFPGCRRSAEAAGTDVDHTIAYPAGATVATNLAVLCRRHHRLKHRARWQASLNPDGVMVWTTPSGRSLETWPWQYSLPPPPEPELDEPPPEPGFDSG